jgi:eukaryotic-like serine/threonine-protein kinase
MLNVGRVATRGALRPGTVVSGKIRIERVVGQGSTGIVLEATDLPLQRRVAVKVLAPQRATADAKQRFVREARAAVRLSSEHVTRLIDVGELEDGTPYLVMEYLVGSTLEQLIVRDGVPPIDVAVDWVLQALDGVAEAHRQGFVHRDLKPENLFLCERPGRQPIVKVLDFGAVKDLVTNGTKITRTGSTMGSPAYMAPEQVRADDLDQRADVWALGVTLYELITGKLPFGGESVPQTLAAILRDSYVPLQALRPEAPPDLEAVIACALSKDPAGRYPSAAELLGALSAVRARMPRTTAVTRTIHMGRNFNAGPADPFADTTDMHRLIETDASRVRFRPVLPNAEDEKATLVDLPPSTKKKHLWMLGFAALGAIVIGTIGGVVVTRRPTPRPLASATLPPHPREAGSARGPEAPPSAAPTSSARPPLLSRPRKR